MEKQQCGSEGGATVSDERTRAARPERTAQTGVRRRGRSPGDIPATPRAERSQQDTPRIRLSRANVEHLLAAADSPADLALRDADLRQADLSALDLSGAQLDGALLQGARLRATRLAGASLRGVQLKGAQLTQADLA